MLPTVLCVRAALLQGGESKSGRMQTTGQLGDVMRESASIAHTYARAFLHRHASDNHYFDTTR